MSTVEIIRRRRKRSERRSRSRSNQSSRVGLIAAVLISSALAVGAVAAAVIYSDLSRDLPSLQALSIWLDPQDGMLLQPNEILDRQGEEVLATLDNPAAAGHEYILFEDLPAVLVDAVVASSDPDFWEHTGFQRSPGFGPTIAEQLIANLLLWQEPEGLRKTLRVRLMAAQITEAYGRSQVMEWYLNTANFGHRIQDVDGAARVYFDKSAVDLSTAEAAALAAIARTPDLNPIDTPDLALEQRQSVIEAMFQPGHVGRGHGRACAAGTFRRSRQPSQTTRGR